MHPLFTPPPSDIAPHTREEMRAAVRERVNEAGLNAEQMYCALAHLDEEDGIQFCRNVLRMVEGMRFMLEQAGISDPPGFVFVPVEEIDEDPDDYGSLA